MSIDISEGLESLDMTPEAAVMPEVSTEGVDSLLEQFAREIDGVDL